MAPVEKTLFAVLFAQVLLTLILYLKLAQIRLPIYAKGEVDKKRIRLDPQAWPEMSQKVSNAVSSQFELPVLFFVAILAAFVLDAVDWVLVGLCGVFVLVRVLHAFELVGRNHVPTRFGWFFAGFAVVCLIWAWLGAHIFVLR